MGSFTESLRMVSFAEFAGGSDYEGLKAEIEIARSKPKNRSCHHDLFHSPSG
jgi:hypothetical protein